MVKRNIVNGALLGSNAGENVSLTVFVEQEVARHSTKFSAKTTDDHTVEVSLNEPLNAPVNGWIEILGTPRSSSSIQTTEVSTQIITLSNTNNSWHKLGNVVKY